MPLPDLYLEGLSQRALLGEVALNAYKLGLMEAILKEALSVEEADEGHALRARMRTALDVARWEPPRSRPMRTS